MVWLFNRSLVGGVLYVTCIPLFWLDDVSMTSPASPNNRQQLFGVLLSLNNCWQFGAILLLNKRWRFGALLLLNKWWNFGNHVLLKFLLAILRYFIAKYTRAIWRHLIANYTMANLATSYCLNRNDRGSKYVFSLVSLILVAIFLF
jgi:hypothetical protein